MLVRWKKSNMNLFYGIIIAVVITAIQRHLQYETNKDSSLGEASRATQILSILTQALCPDITCLFIIFPLLMGKFKPLAYLLKLRLFGVLRKLMVPQMYLIPVMYLRYYYGQGQMITINDH